MRRFGKLVITGFTVGILVHLFACSDDGVLNNRKKAKRSSNVEFYGTDAISTSNLALAWKGGDLQQVYVPSNIPGGFAYAPSGIARDGGTHIYMSHTPLEQDRAAANKFFSDRPYLANHQHKNYFIDTLFLFNTSAQLPVNAKGELVPRLQKFVDGGTQGRSVARV